MPDILYILLDRTVGRELAAACCVEDSSLCPPLLITVCLIDLSLCLCVGAEILQDEVSICTVAGLCI